MRRILPLSDVALFFLIGYAMAFSCHRHARAAGNDRAGNVTVTAPDREIASQIVSKLVRQPKRRVAVQVRYNANAGVTATAFRNGLASIWVDGSSMKSWIDGISWGLGVAGGIGKRGTGFLRFGGDSVTDADRERLRAMVEGDRLPDWCVFMARVLLELAEKTDKYANESGEGRR